MKLSPARILLVLLFVFIGCFGVAYAAAGMLTALPAPAIGGTCGPSTGSETALEALAKPGSIGAGPEPSTSNTTGHHQWQTFVQQCQALADRRGLASLAVLVVSLAVAGVGLIWVLRKPKQDGVDGPADQDELTGTPAYTPLGLHEQAALVGAGAVVGTPAAPVAAWPSTQPPVYGAPPAYPSPPYPGTPVDGGYPPPAWPAQPPGTGPVPPPAPYPEQPTAHSPQSYPPVAPPYPTATPPPAAYPAPTYPAPADPQQATPEQGWSAPVPPAYPPAPPYPAYPADPPAPAYPATPAYPAAPPYPPPPAQSHEAPPVPPYPAPPAQTPATSAAIESAAAPLLPPVTAPDDGDVGAGDTGGSAHDPPGAPGHDPAPPA
jgi:hypothetical protein